jgi:hypothetical protein
MLLDLCKRQQGKLGAEKHVTGIWSIHLVDQAACQGESVVGPEPAFDAVQ